jgi:hypothetical protein
MRRSLYRLKGADLIVAMLIKLRDAHWGQVNILPFLGGAGDENRTRTMFPSRDFLTTPYRYGRYFTVVVWTMSSPYLIQT